MASYPPLTHQLIALFSFPLSAIASLWGGTATEIRFRGEAAAYCILLLLVLAALALALEERGVSTDVLLIDGDSVEPKNVGRQLFSPADVGRNKAEVFAARLNAAFGTRIGAAARAIDRRDTFRQPHALSVVVGAVHNAAPQNGLVEKHVFCQPARKMRADQFPVLAQVIERPAAVIALMAMHVGGDRQPIAGLEVTHLLADLRHHAGDLMPEHLPLLFEAHAMLQGAQV